MIFVTSPFNELAVLLVTFIINILFGYWRAATKKLTAEWFLAVHLPIPIVYSLRIVYGIPITHIPVFVISYFLGQFSGGRVRRWLELRSPLTKCLIVDLIRL